MQPASHKLQSGSDMSSITGAGGKNPAQELHGHSLKRAPLAG
jgi:hypothetical protein